jgi:hypothetical protein
MSSDMKVRVDSILSRKQHWITLKGLGLYKLGIHCRPPINSSVKGNKACTQQVGIRAIYRHFLDFGFILLPSRVSSRPLAGNSSR